jgi:hypothetical protein
LARTLAAGVRDSRGAGRGSHRPPSVSFSSRSPLSECGQRSDAIQLSRDGHCAHGTCLCCVCAASARAARARVSRRHPGHQRLVPTRPACVRGIARQTFA